MAPGSGRIRTRRVGGITEDNMLHVRRSGLVAVVVLVAAVVLGGTAFAAAGVDRKSVV